MEFQKLNDLLKNEYQISLRVQKTLYFVIIWVHKVIKMRDQLIVYSF